MPFAMTHLIISENVSRFLPDRIDNFPQYYLGTIAPDAVHNRANYDSDFKKGSHLITGNEKWGMVTDNDEWKRNVIDFLNKNKSGANRDFVLGYCCHILADMYNNIFVWTPYRLGNPDLFSGGLTYNNPHHQNENKIDIELALTYGGSDFFWRNLEKSASIGFDGIIYAEEIDRQKELILHQWYSGKSRQEIPPEDIAGTMKFIENSSDFIVQVFRENL